MGRPPKETPNNNTTTATRNNNYHRTKYKTRVETAQPMLQPQLKVEVMLEIYQSATVVTLTTMGNVLQSVRSAKELSWRKTTEIVMKIGAVFLIPNGDDLEVQGDEAEKDPGSLAWINADE
ncbi:hypothetical protein Tco_0810066 [Tanacetum coccineum]